MSSSVPDRVRNLIEPLLDPLGLEVVDVEQAGQTLRVFVDRDGGIDLDGVSQATTVVSEALDRAEPLPGHYVLEVSSPGIERPLRTPQQFQRVVGALVSVKTHPEVEGERRIDGTLVAANHEGIIVSVEPAGGERRLGYGEIERARTRFAWEPKPKPGRPAKASKRTRQLAPPGESSTAPGGVGAPPRRGGGVGSPPGRKAAT